MKRKSLTEQHARTRFFARVVLENELLSVSSMSSHLAHPAADESTDSEIQSSKKSISNHGMEATP